MRRYHGSVALDRNHSGFHPSHLNSFLYIHLLSTEREKLLDIYILVSINRWLLGASTA